jgi:hypothetical protein
MRELYACQLDLHLQPEAAADPAQLIQEWIARGSGASVPELLAATSEPLHTDLGHQLEIEQISTDSGDGWTCSWRQPDDRETSLLWRTLIAIGPSPTADVRVTIRIGVERAHDAFHITPAGFTFAPPAIVRTLLREHQMADAGMRVEPQYRTCRAGDIADLVKLLADPQRRLPVVVVTCGPGARTAFDLKVLAMQLAGVAHVELLTTHLAALALTDEVSKPLSVWGGAVRVYWPHFATTDDPRRHPLWLPSRVARSEFLTDTVTWFGSQAAASVPEHPIVATARAARRTRLVQDADLPDWVTDYVDATDEQLEDLAEENRALRAERDGSREQVKDLLAEVAALREQFAVVSASIAANSSPLEDSAGLVEIVTVEDAFNLARAEAGDHIVYLDTAVASVQAFASYDDPRKLYEALTLINDAANAWQNDSLGAGFGAYFNERGYGYSQRNPAATARPTRAYYRRSYNGDTITMEPHLKVDESSKPDQCLRVYWYIDDDGKKLVIGHVGRHLPD